MTQNHRNSKGKEGIQTAKRQENSMNRRYNHFSGSTHSFGFFFSNSDTYLTPWTGNCWLSGVLGRNGRDTGSANAAREQTWSWENRRVEEQNPKFPGQGLRFLSSCSRERAARTAGMREQLRTHTGMGQEKHLSKHGWGQWETGDEKG